MSIIWLIISSCLHYICIYIYSRWVTNGNLRTLMIFQKMCVIMFTLNICWTCIYNYISSGKHTKNYGKSPFLMGKLTISMAIFQLAFSMFTRPGISPWFGANNTHMIICLVVEPYPSEKYARQLGLLFPIYGKIKFMFQTTNQI